MKIYDISQEVFGCAIYPGDPSPSKETLSSIERGELYNLTAFSMCAHNGTHVDAPYHFIHDGKTVDKMPMEKTVGAAYVAEYSGSLDRDGAIAILKKSGGGETSRRILIKGDVIVTESAASVFAEYGIELLGVESQSVGPIDAPMAVHKILLEKEVALLPFNMHGTGDLFTSVMTSGILTGHSLEDSVDSAARFIYDVMEYSRDVEDANERGVAFEPFVYRLHTGIYNTEA